jgi:hypothetical protein
MLLAHTRAYLLLLTNFRNVVCRMVTFPGTHNSNAIKTNFPNLAQHQQLTFAEQLKVRAVGGGVEGCQHPQQLTVAGQSEASATDFAEQLRGGAAPGA